MPDQGSVIPISDEQAKAIQEAIKALRGVGGFLKEILGTVPQDLIGYFGGDLLKVRRAENFARTIQKAKARLDARNAVPEPPSISILLPLVVAAAEESRDELQDIWARLLAAAADPARAKSFRIQFIEVAKQMDPLDARVLEEVNKNQSGQWAPSGRDVIKDTLKVSQDEVLVSFENLTKVGCLSWPAHGPHINPIITSLGKLLMQAVRD
jgi:Abortive infection alpha